MGVHFWDVRVRVLLVIQKPADVVDKERNPSVLCKLIDVPRVPMGYERLG